MRFDGKVAFVTGGRSGIGAATADLLRRGGATVVTAGSTGGPGVETCDISDEGAVEALIHDLVKRYGRIDYAVNNAGISGQAMRIDEMTTTEWNRMMEVNLSGVFFCLRAELAVMRQAGHGSIVNVSSRAGLHGLATMAHYSAAKFGVIGLTKSAALEVAREGVRVNAVCPGSIWTPQLRRWHSGDDEEFKKTGNIWPMGRLGDPSEIAEPIAWLLSEESSYLTGIALEIDGGGAAL